MEETPYLRGPFPKKLHLCPNAAYSGSTHCIDKNFPIPILAYQRGSYIKNIEDVVLTEVPKLMVDASELVLTPI